MTKSYVAKLPLSEPDECAVAIPESPGFSSFAVDFLVQCLSVGREPSAVGREPTIDWTRVVDVAIERNLAPLLLSRLRQADAEARVPAEEWARLQRAFLVSVGRSERVRRGLGRLLAALGEQGMSVVVLKGAYLAEAVYGDIALRPMGDVDLLVREAELEPAQVVLDELGGVHREYDGSESGFVRGRHLPHTTVGRLVVELHWNIVSPAGPVQVDVAGLWRRARPCRVAGVQTLCLAPEDLLLHLCLHTCYEDHLASLRGLVDITETARRFRGELDWEQLAARAGQWGGSRYVGLALHLARAMLGADVPEPALALLVPGGISPDMLEAARQSLLDQSGYGRWLSFFGMARANTLAEKAGLAWRRVFLSRSEMAATYPKSRVGFFLAWYYGRRVVDLVGRYLSHSLRRRRLLRQGRDHAALVRWLVEDGGQ